jgi:hypothetical protein
MGVPCQTPASAARRLVCELKAQREDEGQHTFDKGLAISKQPKIGRFVLKIDREGAVVPCPFARLAHVSPMV